MISDSIFKLHIATEEIKINFSNPEDEFKNDWEEKKKKKKKEVYLNWKKIICFKKLNLKARE